ncbi:hypothetical protein DPMN_088710 [Dreissena polymorpha]|uniref:Uncharacterized protein n=1 Tax=Dreissena polymorpha TaxID=45954 RepID=A0A9D4KVJ4_DREPO|nr:hypothetical protein DPMN_088710 [Dreissena polymorpha]
MSPIIKRCVTFNTQVKTSKTKVTLIETGLLLVCGCESNNVVQVDGEAGVVTLASWKDGLNKPQFVYYSARTGTLIVGHISDNILVIHIK